MRGRSESHPVREPPHRGRRGRGGVFDLAMGVGKGHAYGSYLFFGGGQIFRFSRPRQLVKTVPM